MFESLEAEGKAATDLLSGKTVLRVFRRRAPEVGIEFSDGTRMFVDIAGAALELSISGSGED